MVTVVAVDEMEYGGGGPYGGGPYGGAVGPAEDVLFEAVTGDPDVALEVE